MGIVLENSNHGLDRVHCAAAACEQLRSGGERQIERGADAVILFGRQARPFDRSGPAMDHQPPGGLARIGAGSGGSFVRHCLGSGRRLPQPFLSAAAIAEGRALASAGRRLRGPATIPLASRNWYKYDIIILRRNDHVYDC
jgi:hypothetical protein